MLEWKLNPAEKIAHTVAWVLKTVQVLAVIFAGQAGIVDYSLSIMLAYVI